MQQPTKCLCPLCAYQAFGRDFKRLADKENAERAYLMATRRMCPPDERRRAYIVALGVAVDALDDERFNACCDWLMELSHDLEDLDKGVAPPALRCEVQNKVLPTNVWLLRLRAVMNVEALHLTGMKYFPAATRAISAMQLEGVLEKDVLSWRTEFAKGRVKHRDAAARYKNTMCWLKSLDSARLEEFAQDAWGMPLGVPMWEFGEGNPPSNGI